jgi:site-specific DNA-methyltransferase (cytosine-N4-specific)
MGEQAEAARQGRGQHSLVVFQDRPPQFFSGSNVTGFVAERVGRRWLSIELDRAYSLLSAVRFMEGQSERAIRDLYDELQRREVLTLRLPVAGTP